MRVPLPLRKRDRDKLLAALARYGERVAEPGEKKSAVFGSALEPDLFAEAVGLSAGALRALPSAIEGAVDEFPLPDNARPLQLYFGQIAVDLGFLNDAQRREVLRAQRSSLLRRSFSATAVALGILTLDQAEAIAAAQAQRLADAAAARRTRSRRTSASIRPPLPERPSPSSTRPAASAAPRRSASRSRCSTS